MAAALLATLSRESRTSLGEPVVPEVLSRSARSGCRSCALVGRRTSSRAPGVQTDVRVVGRDGRVALGRSAVGDDEGDVAVLERGEVGDERVEVVGALDQDEPAGRAPGGRAVRDAPGQLGVGEDLVAGEHGGSGAEARVVEDRADRRCDPPAEVRRGGAGGAAGAAWRGLGRRERHGVSVGW